jgi:hypothetical protein
MRQRRLRGHKNGEHSACFSTHQSFSNGVLVEIFRPSQRCAQALALDYANELRLTAIPLSDELEARGLDPADYLGDELADAAASDHLDYAYLPKDPDEVHRLQARVTQHVSHHPVLLITSCRHNDQRESRRRTSRRGPSPVQLRLTRASWEQESLTARRMP